MAGISGLDGMTVGQVVEEVRRGGRFVYFQYCIVNASGATHP
jgi:hypothetical protein